MKMRRVGRYEVGRTIGEGTFAKVKFARNTETGGSFAMKVLAKSTILKHKMVEQIKREISIMKIVRHPNIVRLHEVLSSKTKIYIVLEFITGGELYDKIVHQGRLSENISRRYFQQLIDAVDYCHGKGVYHRDLKPENLLLDFQGNLKISDFGLSALPQQGVELLYTTCGTPNYVAPEISTANFSFPSWFAPAAKSLISRILDPNPRTRIQIVGIKEDPWFRKNYVAVKWGKDEEVSLDDVCAVFDDIEDQYVSEQMKNDDNGPLMMNAFEMITLSQGLNLSALFDRRQDFVKRQTRFVSRKPPKVIISTIEAAAESMGLSVHSRNYKMRLERISANKTGQFAVVLEVYEVAPSLFMVDVRKASGDTLEYHKFYKDLCTKLENIIWKSAEGTKRTQSARSMSC